MKRAIVKKWQKLQHGAVIANSSLLSHFINSYVIRQITSLFSKIDSNKSWHDVQNEETVIYAKFGKDLFNI